MNARYPTDPAVTGLVDELRDASPDFARLWQRHDVQAAPMLQHLVLYSAPPGSPGADALALLNVLGAEASDYRR
jgi:hypothetical protein